MLAEDVEEIGACSDLAVLFDQVILEKTKEGCVPDASPQIVEEMHAA